MEWSQSRLIETLLSACPLAQPLWETESPRTEQRSYSQRSRSHPRKPEMFSEDILTCHHPSAGQVQVRDVELPGQAVRGERAGGAWRDERGGQDREQDRDISPCRSLRLHCCHPVMLSAASHPSWGFEKSETSVAMYGTTCRARWWRSAGTRCSVFVCYCTEPRSWDLVWSVSGQIKDSSGSSCWSDPAPSSASLPPTTLPSHYNLSSWCGILEIFLLKWNLQIWCCSRQKREYFMNQIFINRYFRAGTSGSTSLTGENSQAKDVIIVTSRAGVSRCPAFWSSSSSPTRSSKGLYLVRNSVQIL